MITFDIETAPLPDEQIAPFVPEFSAPSNYKDPEKIKAYIEGEKVKWLEQAALSPLTGRVVAIGILALGELVLASTTNAVSPDFKHDDLAVYPDESLLLMQFWRDYKHNISE